MLPFAQDCSLLKSVFCPAVQPASGSLDAGLTICVCVMVQPLPTQERVTSFRSPLNRVAYNFQQWPDANGRRNKTLNPIILHQNEAAIAPQRMGRKVSGAAAGGHASAQQGKAKTKQMQKQQQLAPQEQDEEAEDEDEGG